MDMKVIRRFGVPAALAATLIGGASLEGLAQAHDTHARATHGVTLNPDHVELSSSSQQFHQMRWPLAEGPSGANNYASMIGNLRQLARRYANAESWQVTDAEGVRRTIDMTDQSQDNQFADVVIALPGGPALHAIVRLSNYYVVQFYYVNNGQRHTYTLGTDVAVGDGGVSSGYPEGYDALSGPHWANRALNTINLGYTAFESAVHVLRNPGASQQAVARSMQTLIIGIAEGARIRNVEESVHARWRTWDQYTLADDDVHAIHNWGAGSAVFRDDGGRSLTVYGRSIHDRATAALIYLTVLGIRLSGSDAHRGEL
ncbi:ribosome-inactivating family protein [Streptomyces sp. IBSBF 2953]|uniref:ribosome-inactivating family protein n=1 Tax=Streptomyces TaxID=1883 RepID=UPI00211A7A66|nr:ribosome-inactivating family protein [Streptomyces scabiei]MCQ9179654.1 ribosome-inactivating family protein [Streptomyces hayashii]MDX3116815.1 ribosome-inactivating family protein [Streptomyces scabiei]